MATNPQAGKEITADQANNYLGKYVEVANPNAAEDNFAVLMELKNILRLLGHEDCVKLAAIIGVVKKGSGLPEITISLLAVNKDDKILPEHIRGTFDGEEVWPKKIAMSEINTLLPEPEY